MQILVFLSVSVYRQEDSVVFIYNSGYDVTYNHDIVDDYVASPALKLYRNPKIKMYKIIIKKKDIKI